MGGGKIMGRLVLPGQSVKKGYPTPKKQEQSENLPQYLARNIAKLPAQAYGMIRSGLGAGDIFKAANEENILPRLAQTAALGPLSALVPESVTQGIQDVYSYLQPKLLPTGEEARKELSFLPEYMTQSRPEDYPFEFVAQEAPLALLLGGGKQALTTGAGLARSAARSAGHLIGGTLGGELGGAIGGAFGAPKTGELLGGAAGMVGGGRLAEKGTQLLPSRQQPKIEAKERMKFHEEQLAKAKEFEKIKVPELADMEQWYRITEESLPQEKAAFQKQKSENLKKAQEQQAEGLKNIQGKIKSYDTTLKNLKESRTELYDKAAALENNARVDVKPAHQDLVRIYDEVAKGVDPTDAKSIRAIVKDLEKSFKRGEGEMPLKELKVYQKNINDQRYNKGTSANFRKYTSQIVNTLNDLIKKAGSEEHNKAWELAEKSHQQYKKLLNNRKEYMADAKQELQNIKTSGTQEIQNIKSSSFSPEREMFLKRELRDAKQQFDSAKKNYEAATKAIGKETYDDLLKSREAQEKVVTKFDKIVDLADRNGAAGLASAMGYYFGLGGPASALIGFGTKLAQKLGTEYKAFKDIAKNHPEIYADYAKIIKDTYRATNKDIPTLVTGINRIGKQLEEYRQSEKRPKTQRRRLVLPV